MQSPININNSKTIEIKENDFLILHYNKNIVHMYDTGYTVEFRTNNEEQYIILDNKRYIFSNFHFHTPSEHTLDNQKFPLEMHLVNRNENNEIAVLTIFFKIGKENNNLLLSTNNNKELNIDFSKLINPNNFYFFNGSLTTPPFSENVKWIVFQEILQLSQEQFKFFTKYYSNNARILQDLEQRDIFKFKTNTNKKIEHVLYT